MQITGHLFSSIKSSSIDQIKPYKSIIREALNLIEQKFSQKLYILGENFELIPLRSRKKLTFEKENLLFRHIERFKTILINFVLKSDITASLIIKLLKCPNFKFTFADNSLKNLRNFKDCTGLYFAELKTFLITPLGFELTKDNPEQLQNILIHESVHAIDDLAAPDSDPNNPTCLSKDILKEKIKTMACKELENTKKLMKSLKELRIKKLKEQSPNISEKEIKDSFKKRPLFRVCINSREEVELLKKSTWCWNKSSKKGYINAPLISVLDSTNSLDFFISEYIAEGVAACIRYDSSMYII